METSVPIILRKHHIITGNGKVGKTDTVTKLKVALAEKGITLYHLDLDLERGVDHYPNARNIKIGSMADIYTFQKNAYEMHSKGLLSKAVLVLDPLNPIFEWMAEETIQAYGSDNFIADKRMKFEGVELNALSAFYTKCKTFIQELESWFPFMMSVIHLKRSEIMKEDSEGKKTSVLYDSYQLYGQMRSYMHHKTDGAIMFGSKKDLQTGEFITTINQAQANVMNSLGMRKDPELQAVTNSDELIDYYVKILPIQFDYLIKRNKELKGE